MHRAALVLLALWAAMALVSSAAADAPPVRPIVLDGAGPVPGEAAPWSVYVAKSGSFCSGSLIALDTVVTAAHCVFNRGTLRDIGEYTVWGGVVDGSARPPTFTAHRSVRAVVVHPQEGVDVALLRLTEPLPAGPSIAPIALSPSRPRTDFAVGRVYGFGFQGDVHLDLNLRLLPDLAFLPAWRCGPDSATVLCGVSQSGGTCGGDSGAGLVAGDPAVLIGVNSYGEVPCGPGKVESYMNALAPAINAFLRGDLAPPAAPRLSLPAALRGRAGRVVCESGGWSGTPALVTRVLDSRTGDVLAEAAEGVAELRVSARTAGVPVTCEVTATNAGGEAVLRFGAGIAQPLLDRRLGLTVTPRRLHVRVTALATVPLTVTYASATGAVVRRMTFDSDEASGLVPTLAPGRYRVCLTAPADDLYAAAEACADLAVNGAAIRLLTARRQAGRLTLRVDPAARGARARVTRRTVRCTGLRCRTTHSLRTVRLGPALVVRVPRGARRVRVTVAMPAIRGADVTFVAGRASWTVARRGDR